MHLRQYCKINYTLITSKIQVRKLLCNEVVMQKFSNSLLNYYLGNENECKNYK